MRDWVGEFDKFKDRDLEGVQVVELNALFRQFIDTVPSRELFGLSLSYVTLTADMLHAILEHTWRTDIRTAAHNIRDVA